MWRERVVGIVLLLIVAGVAWGAVKFLQLIGVF